MNVGAEVDDTVFVGDDVDVDLVLDVGGTVVVAVDRDVGFGVFGAAVEAEAVAVG